MRRTVVVAVLAALTIAAPARAEFPGENGRITFMRADAAGAWQVWVANRDLSAAARITTGPANNGWPVWSPNGRRIAFDSDVADPDLSDDVLINDVLVMRPDGSGVTNLTGGQGFAGDAAWSPDGSRIAFEADRPGRRGPAEIWTMRADGSHRERVTTLPADAANDFAPRFSPDGSRLVFTRYRGVDESETAAVFTIRTNGRSERQLTPFSLHAGDADWSPDGRHLVFEAYPQPFSRGDVYVVGANGRHLVNLTHNVASDPAGSADPVWAPDGRRILFLDLRVIGGETLNGLATMAPDGSHRRFLTPEPMLEHQPDWESVPAPCRHHCQPHRP